MRPWPSLRPLRDQVAFAVHGPGEQPPSGPPICSGPTCSRSDLMPELGTLPEPSVASTVTWSPAGPSVMLTVLPTTSAPVIFKLYGELLSTCTVEDQIAVSPDASPASILIASLPLGGPR